MSYNYRKSNKSDSGSVAGGVFFFGVLVGIFFLSAWVTELLWNSVLVSAVDWANPISYWYSAGLLILCGILFGRVSGGN